MNQPPKPSKPDLKKATPTKFDRDAKVSAAKGPIARAGSKSGSMSASPPPKLPAPPPHPTMGAVFAGPPPGPPPAVAAGPPISPGPPQPMQQQYDRLDGRALAQAILGHFAAQVAQPGMK